MSQSEERDPSIPKSNASDISGGSKENTSHLRYPSSYGKNSNAASKIGTGFQHDTSPRSSTSSKEQGIVLTADTEQFIIGQRVWVGGTSPGQIAYIGETHFAPGEWAGIVLDEPNGKNDGCVAGKRYFQCESKKGIFSRLTRLTVQPLEGAIAKGVSKLSPDRSCTVSPTPSTRSTLNRSAGKHGFQLGDRVIVSSGFGSRPGILRFLGETQFASGNWCGIELDEATGKNDGSVDGVRYFECIAKYGIFVPIAKVSLSPSSKKTRLSRAGSRESLTSVGTMNSIATTNTSRLRMQRRSSSINKQVNPPSTKSNFSMQDLIREKQNHIEQLLIERDLDQEDAQNQTLQFQKIISELKSKIVNLESKLEEEKSKTEELQFSIEEATFCGDELNAQTQVYKEKISDLEQRLQAVNIVNENTSLQPSDEDLFVKSSQSYSTNANLSKSYETEKALANESLSAFRDLICKIRDFGNQENDFQEKLNLYIGNPDEICHLIKSSQTGDTLLTESLTMAIKELNSMRFELETAKTKCKDLENTLKASGEETDRLEVERIDISQKLQDVTSNSKTLSELSDKLQEELKISEEKIKHVELEKLDISQKLEELASSSENVSKQNDELRKEFKITEEKTKLLEAENVDLLKQNDILQQEVETGLKLNEEKTKLLEELTSNFESLSKQNDQLNQELKVNEEKTKLLEVEKHDIAHKLEELTSNCESESSQNNKLQLELEISEEKTKLLEVEKFNISRELSEITAKYSILSGLNDELQAELKTNEEKIKQLEVEKLDISGKLEKVTSSSGSFSEMNDKLQQELKVSEEKSKRLEVEKFDISRKLEDVGSNVNNLSELNDKLQQDLKTNDEKTKLLEVNMFDISRELGDAKSNCDSLSKINDKLHEELKTNEEKTKRLEVEKFDISRKLEDITLNCKNLSELNDTLQQTLRSNEEKVNQLEVHNFEISRKLEDMTSDYERLCELQNKQQQELISLEGATSNCGSLLELNDKLQLQLKIVEEKTKQLEVEKFDISRKLEDSTLNCKNLSELNDKLQQELKTNEEKTKRLEVEMFDISRQLEDAASNYKSLLELNGTQQQQLKANEEKSNRLEGEKFDISRKLEDATLNCTSLSEQIDKLKQTLRANEEKTSQLEVNNFDISRKLEDITSNCKSLSELNDKLQEELKIKTESSYQLEVQKSEISRTLEDITSEFKRLSELYDKLQEQLQNNEEKTSQLEVEKLEITRKLEEVTSNCTSLSDHNKSLQQELQASVEKYNQTQGKNGDISEKLEDVTSNCTKLSELNEKLQQELKTNGERVNQLEVENSEIIRKLEEITINYGNLSEHKEKLEQELKTNEEKTNHLAGESNVIIRKLEDVTSNCESLAEQNKRLQQELVSQDISCKECSQKLEEVTLNCENLMEQNKKLQQELVSQNVSSKEFIQKFEELTTNCASLSDQNKKLREELASQDLSSKEFVQKLDALTITCASLTDQNKKLKEELATISSKHLELLNDEQQSSEKLRNTENKLVYASEQISETQQVHQKECSSEHLYLGNELKDVNKVLNLITIQMESLDQDIRSISPDSKIHAELLSSAEEKSCKLQFDCSDLTRRLEALKENYEKFSNQNYTSLKELISEGILGKAKGNLNTLDEPTIKLWEHIRLLQDKVINYQLVFMVKEAELAKQLANISSKTSPADRVEIECLLNSLHIDLESTRNFITRIEGLKLSLKSVSYSYFKLAKNNAQFINALQLLKEENLPVSSNFKMNDLDMSEISEHVEEVNKKLQVECFQLTKFLANSIQLIDNFREGVDKSKPTLNETILPISSVEGFIERINKFTNSYSGLSNSVAEKIKIIQAMRASQQSVRERTGNVEKEFNSKNENNLQKVDFSKNQNTSGNNTIVQKQSSEREASLEYEDDSMEDKTAHINFLNSIIADMQQKNDTLKAKITALESLSTDYQKSHMYSILTARKPAPRMFCDICDQFDLHETEDCPVQESDGGDGGEPALHSIEARSSNDMRELPEPRKYCANCEAFGDHTTDDCYGGLE